MPDPTRKLDARTWVPIGLLGSLLITAIYGTAYVVNAAGDFRNSQGKLVEGQAAQSAAISAQAVATNANTDAVRDLSTSLANLQRDLNDRTTDRWRATDMRFLWLSTQAALDRAGIKVELPPVTTLDHTTQSDGGK